MQRGECIVWTAAVVALAAGFRCDGSSGQRSCRSDDECTGGRRCVDGRCVEVPAADADGDDGGPADHGEVDPDADSVEVRDAEGGEGEGDAGADGDGEVDVPDVPPPPAELPLGFWCGPPDAFISAERYREVREAGFNFLMPPCEGAATPARNRTILDAALAAGLKAWVGDQRMPMAVGGVPDAAARLDAIVADYAAHPALAGYYVTDEPGAPAFAGLAEVVAGLRARDPEHPAYVNLLPNYATPEQLGTPTYREHVALFLDTVRPEILSYDHYHFLTGGDRPGFFDNLRTVRDLALSHDVPFWQIVLLTPHYGYRPLSEAEKRWEAMQTLAYGGKGVMFFTYWTPPDPAFAPAIIDRDGSRTAAYAEVQRINAAAAAIGRELLPALSTGAFQSGALAPGGTPRVPGAAALVPGEAPLTVGTFASGADVLVLVTNRDYLASVSSDVVLAGGTGAVERLDVGLASWVDAGAAVQPDGTRLVSVTLDAGAAALFRLRGPVSPGPPGAEAMVGTVRADAGSMFLVDAAHGTAWLGAGGWDSCFEGFALAGHDFQSNGFWLCARNDLAAGTFYVGNVVGERGYYWRVRGGAAEPLGDASWDTCAAGALLGRRFESNGFWICME